MRAELLRKGVITKTTICGVSSCASAAKTAGYCQRHYMVQHRAGTNPNSADLCRDAMRVTIENLLEENVRLSIRVVELEERLRG